MEDVIFTNVISINASYERIEKILFDLNNIIHWDTDILEVVSVSKNQFLLLRQNTPFNQEELVTIKKLEDHIIDYQVEGKINYTVRWQISNNRLSQSLIVKNNKKIRIISRLMSRIMQEAFMQNLYALKALYEVKEL